MAAFNYTENFDGYSAATINGQDGWVVVGTANNIQAETGTVLQGTKSIEIVNGISSAKRTISTFDSGTWYFMVQCHTAPSSGDGTSIAFRRNSGGNYLTNLKFSGTSPLKLQYFSSGAYTDLIASASLDTLYWVGIQYDGAGSQFKIRYGTSSSWTTSFGSFLPTGTASTTTIDQIQFSQDNGDGFADNITVTDPFSGVTYSLSATVGAFTLTGIAAAFKKVLHAILSVGAFVLTGVSVTFTKATGYALVAGVGSFILSGVSAIFNFSGWTPQSKNNSSYSNTTKHTSSWTNLPKP